MVIDEVVGTIEVKGNGVVEVNKFISYGNSEHYFAIVGKDLYYQINEHKQPEYELLKKDFRIIDELDKVQMVKKVI